MPDPGELLGTLIRVVGEILNASQLRLGAGPTLAVLGVLLVVLQLVARPVSRWTTRDPGGLGAVGRAMAVAAESGTAALVSLGGGGIARGTSAAARLQTVGALPILGHVVRAAARSGVPLRVAVNDPLAAVLAAAAVREAHRQTVTPERSGRSRVQMVGEGRPATVTAALGDAARPAAAFAAGSIGEEATLLFAGLSSTAGSGTFGTAEAAQAPSLVLSGGGALIGPELYAAAADLRAAAPERSAAIAANRVIVVVIAVLVVGSLLAVFGVFDLRPLLLGIE